MASLSYLGLWIASALLLYASLLVGYEPAVALLTRGTWVLFLPAFGFIGLMIFGMAQQFVPLYSGRNLWSPRFALAQVVVALVGVAVMLPTPAWEALGFGLWLVSCVMFLVLLIQTLRSEKLPVRPSGRHPEYLVMDRLGIPMTSAAVLYLIAASVGFFLQSPSTAPMVPAAWTFYYSWLHLYNLGFIVLMVFGVGFHLLPRFLDTVPNVRLGKIITAMALPGPALVALTLPYLDVPSVEFVFAACALFEAVAAVLFAILVLDVWSRSPRRRPASAFNATAGLWLILGVTFASLFGILPSLTETNWVPAHGWINFFGFAGFEIFGVTHEVLPPFTSLGLRVSHAVTRADFALANAGLALLVISFGASVVGLPVDGEILAIAGLALLLAMVVLYASGVLWSLLGIVRSRPSK